MNKCLYGLKDKYPNSHKGSIYSTLVVSVTNLELDRSGIDQKPLISGTAQS